MLDKISTGITGLDTLLGGGLLRGEVILVGGAPGSGKTTFGLQFIHHGVSACSEGGLVITFEQFPEQIYRDALNFGWDFRQLEADDKVRVVCTSPKVFADLLRTPDGLLDRMTGQVNARRIFIDSITHFEDLAGDTAQIRDQVFGLMNALKRRGFTVLLSMEERSATAMSGAFESYIVDAVLRIGNEPAPARPTRIRTIEILKTRGQSHVSGKHHFIFGNDGITMFPSDATLGLPEPPPLDAAQVDTGIAGLDALLDGGMPQGSSLLLSGEAGTGKTILGLQFLVHGVLHHGEPGMLLMYEESVAQMEAIARGFGWDLDALQESEKLTILPRPFAALDPDQHWWEIREMLAATGVRRLVLDSLSSALQSLAGDPRAVTDKINQIVRIGQSMGVTSVLISTVPTASGQVSSYGVEESLVDAVIVLRTKHDGPRRKRSLEVYKVRGSNHVLGKYGMAISSEGMKVFYHGGRTLHEGDD